MEIRPATETDLPQLAQLYHEAVCTLAPQHYTPQQVAVWASFGRLSPAFRHFILDANTFVVDRDEQILGFCGIDSKGHLTSLYVHPQHIRQHIGSQLVQRVLDYATQHRINPIFVEASHFSRPLFEKFGFRLTEIEQIQRDGVIFERFHLQRHRAC
ncbi:GNAT family N-acetyltransferase [Spirulina subsalsa FACHB-351]|uniref:GNAT family N-acetyltransferase n=1 Tax=Spirulina subsalsa FACHB-351 TaxID=234711 RepID=A0ABT3L2Q6_9CYAN|nr:GNAT family N-acetyltransferase [Spirulina subsalsa]MCW6035797.1 GNAT family N-acetyltransferase [Spirulina subsalsa FACHB-351]